MIDKFIENKVYEDLEKFKNDIKFYSELFKVDKKLITSILYVETIHYKLPNIKKTFHRYKTIVLKKIDSTENENSLIKKMLDKILNKINVSRGISNIKFNTAKEVYKHRLIEQKDVTRYCSNPKRAIKVTCAIIRLHIDQWKSEIDISDNIPILATLYNISNFRNKKPHKNPKSGGSELGVIVDGEYIEKMCFGDRVLKVYNSKSMKLFWEK